MGASHSVLSLFFGIYTPDYIRKNVFGITKVYFGHKITFGRPKKNQKICSNHPLVICFGIMGTSYILLGTFFGIYAADYPIKSAFGLPKAFFGPKNIKFGKKNDRDFGYFLSFLLAIFTVKITKVSVHVHAAAQPRLGQVSPKSRAIADSHLA